MSTVPANNVSYRIQNVDFAVFLGLVDEYPVNKTQSKASIVARPKKDGVATQEWILSQSGDGWTIANHGSSFYLGNNNPPAATFYNRRTGVPASAKVIIEQENDTNIVKIRIGDGVLQCSNGFDLGIAPDEDVDKGKWRLLEVCPILGQVGFKYRLRGFNGRILNLDGRAQLSAMLLADATKDASNRTLWAIEPAAGATCTVKLVGGGTDDYLSCKSVYTKGQDNWVVSKGAEFRWDLESIGGFAYQIIKRGKEKDLAVTVENDQEIILKPNKVGHGQIWLLERDYN